MDRRKEMPYRISLMIYGSSFYEWDEARIISSRHIQGLTTSTTSFITGAVNNERALFPSFSFLRSKISLQSHPVFSCASVII